MEDILKENIKQKQELIESLTTENERLRQAIRNIASMYYEANEVLLELIDQASDI